jgi:hypothetical protein
MAPFAALRRLYHITVGMTAVYRYSQLGFREAGWSMLRSCLVRHNQI